MVNKKNNIYHLTPLSASIGLIALSAEIESLKQQHKQICEMAARSILQALDLRDHYTYGHSMRVAYYVLLLGKELKMSENEIYDLEFSAIFHDIGKVGIPDSVLLKPSKLTNEEFDMMKTHPVKSAEILDGFDYFQKIAKIVRHHHERYDGKGYPDKMSGDEIPYFSRMILIADTFDAMTSSRPYRKGLPYEVAFQELRDFAGTQFDPKLVEQFIPAIQNDEQKKESTFKLTIIKGEFEKDEAA